MKTGPRPNLVLVACNHDRPPIAQPPAISEEKIRAAAAIKACLSYMLTDAVAQNLTMTAEMIEHTLAALEKDIGL